MLFRNVVIIGFAYRRGNTVAALARYAMVDMV